MIFVSVQRPLNAIYKAGLVRDRDRHSSMIRMLGKSLFSPAQPWRPFQPPALSLPRQPPRPGTRPFPCGVLAPLRSSTYRSVRRASSLAAALLDGILSILRDIQMALGICMYIIPFVLIVEDELRPLATCRSGDGPGDTVFICHADNESIFTVEQNGTPLTRW